MLRPPHARKPARSRTSQLRSSFSGLSPPTILALLGHPLHSNSPFRIRSNSRSATMSKLSSSAKRIQKELAEISLDPPCNCSAGPKGDNIYEWVSSIVGPSGKRGCGAMPGGKHLRPPPAAGCDALWPPTVQAAHTLAASSSWTSISPLTIPSSRPRHGCICAVCCCLWHALAWLLPTSMCWWGWRGGRRHAGGVPHAHLPLQHQQQWIHLPRHPEGPVEPRADHLKSAAVHLLTADRRQPRCAALPFVWHLPPGA